CLGVSAVLRRIFMKQLDVITEKSIATRSSAGVPQLQASVKRLTPHRSDFKAIKRVVSFERVLAHYGIELRGGRGAQRKALSTATRGLHSTLIST
ncbi:MAG: hypothetical protein ACJ8AH_15345, partial [Stellaceae bacterium]